jgi:hypothetical protein
MRLRSEVTWRFVLGALVGGVILLGVAGEVVTREPDGADGHRPVRILAGALALAAVLSAVAVWWIDFLSHNS